MDEPRGEVRPGCWNNGDASELVPLTSLPPVDNFQWGGCSYRYERRSDAPVGRSLVVVMDARLIGSITPGRHLVCGVCGSAAL